MALRIPRPRNFKFTNQAIKKCLTSIFGDHGFSSSVGKQKCTVFPTIQDNPHSQISSRRNYSSSMKAPPSLRKELLCNILDPVQDGLNKVTVVGAGMVGIGCVNAILFQKISSHIALIDAFPKRLKGEGLDYSHGLVFLDDAHFEYDTDFCISSNSKVIIIAAGLKLGEECRNKNYVQHNLNLIKEIILPLTEYSPKAVFIVVTNPVDIMAFMTWKLSGLPVNRIIGSGTNLDTARFRYLLAQRLGVASQSVQAFVIGENGQSQVPLWSGVSIAGVQFRDVRPNVGLHTDEEKWIDLATEATNVENNIKCMKGCLNTAIGLSVADITKAILNNTQSVKTVSTLVQGHYGICQEMFLSLPCIIGQNGITNVVRVRMTELERKMLQNSADAVYKVQQKVKIS